MGKKVFMVRFHSVVDVITNSSSELFIFSGNGKNDVTSVIQEIYPDYLNEYAEIKSIDELTVDELNLVMSYLCSPHCWPAKKSDFPIPGDFTFDELYEKDVRGDYTLKRTEGWDFVTADNVEWVKQKLSGGANLFFLFSLDDNPEWDYQEKLSMIGHRLHLG